MARFINKYLNQSAYDADNTKQYPNTSLVGTEIIFKMEDAFDGIIATFNVTSTSEATKLLERTGNVSKVWIDGVEQTEVIGSYQFLTTGEHEVKYALIDPTTTGNRTFENCTSIISLTIPDSVINIGSRAFRECSSLTSVTIPDSVTSIGNSAFNGCTGLTNIVIPSSVTSISDNAFSDCTSLPVENNIRYADTYAVEAVDKTLTTYTIKEGTKWIGYSAFNKCTGLTSVTIPDSVTSIGDTAFANCSSLTSVTIGSGVTSIGVSAFQNTGLTSITIPDSVTSIGISAFQNCGLTSITIPDSVTSIGNNAFLNCESLESVTINATTPPTLGSYAFQGSYPIYVPAESVEIYKTDTNWSSLADRIVEIPSE